MKPCVFATLLFQIFLISCNSHKGNFSVKAPKDWVVIDSISSTKGKVVQMHAPRLDMAHPFVESIVISIVEFPSVDIYVNNIISDAGKNSFFFEKKGKGSAKVNTYDALWEQHIVQLTKNEPSVEQKVYFIGDYGNIYMIIFTSKVNEMNNFQPTIDSVLMTFRIL
jgi:hypothetical protein